MTPLEMTFWGALGLLAYIYVGYPMMMWGLSRLSPRPIRSAPVAPPITIVIAAHNEAAYIGAKIENCLALAYPADRLNLIVVSDGSTDRTPTIAAGYARRFPERVMLVCLPHRHGKASALNAGVALASGEIILLADARQQFGADVARALAQHFADPEVGAVSGELMLRSNGLDGRGTGLGLYWRYEKALRQAESRWGSSMGYTGAISAIRRSLFDPLPPDTLTDDLVTPLRIIAKQYRVVFEPAALAYDTVSHQPGREFARKVRTLAGVLQTCLHLRAFVRPLPLRVRWQLLSHKLLRLAVPYLLVLAFASNVFLPGTVYGVTLLMQTLAYGLGLTGLIWPSRFGRSRFISIPATFLWLNAAAVVAALRYLTGRGQDLWQPAASDTAHGAFASPRP